MKPIKSLSTLAILTSIVVPAFADEQTISLEQVPAKVAEALKHHAGDNAVTEISKEDKNGHTVFEAKFQTKQGVREVSVDEQGQLLSDEQTIPLENAPTAVQAAINEKATGGKLEKLERVQEKGATTFEALVTNKDGRAEFVFGEDGKLMKTEKKGAKED